MVPNFLDNSDRKVSGKVVLCHVEDNVTKDNEEHFVFCMELCWYVIMHSVCCYGSLQT